MSFSRGTPVTLAVASLTSVILPSGLMVTSGSTLASIRLRAYCAACRCAGGRDGCGRLAASDRDGVGVAPRERDSQSDADVPVHEHIEFAVAGDFLDTKTLTAQTSRNGGARRFRFDARVHTADSRHRPVIPGKNETVPQVYLKACRFFRCQIPIV